MAEILIQCRDCGSEYTASRRDAVRCPSCRLLVILLWASSYWTRAKRCGHCNELFRPIRKRDSLCGGCAPQKHGNPTTCRICKTKAPEFERVPVCAVCVKNPKVRQQVIAALRKGQARRRERSK